MQISQLPHSPRRRAGSAKFNQYFATIAPKCVPHHVTHRTSLAAWCGVNVGKHFANTGDGWRVAVRGWGGGVV